MGMSTLSQVLTDTEARAQQLTGAQRTQRSEAMKASPLVKQARASERGVPKGPASDERKAKRSASHHADKGTPAWDRYYRAYLKILEARREAVGESGPT